MHGPDHRSRRSDGIPDGVKGKPVRSPGGSGWKNRPPIPNRIRPGQRVPPPVAIPETPDDVAEPVRMDPPVRPTGAKPAPATAGEPKSDASKPTKERRLDGEGRPYITLAQLVKLEQLVETGGQAKHFVRSTAIQVNGEAENRPGRKLHDDDVVEVEGRRLVVRVANG